MAATGRWTPFWPPAVTRVTVPVRDPLGRLIQADYGLLEGGRTAVIEMALASGLELLKPAELNPMAASTYGTGELMADALQRGAERVIIGLGGSATVDGGMGCLQALGLRLLDERGDEVPAGGAGLAQNRDLRYGGHGSALATGTDCHRFGC